MKITQFTHGPFRAALKMLPGFFLMTALSADSFYYVEGNEPYYVEFDGYASEYNYQPIERTPTGETIETSYTYYEPEWLPTAEEEEAALAKAAEEEAKVKAAEEEAEKLKIAEAEKASPLPKVKKRQKYSCEGCPASVEEYVRGSIEDLQKEINDLKDQLEDLQSSQDSLADQVDSVGQGPSEELLAKTNFVGVGTGYTFLALPKHENSTFGTVIDPVFLYRYGDNMLFEMKLNIQLLDCSTNIALVFGTLDYVVNDCLTVRVGKYSTPLGLVWEKMTTGWINKLPNLPLPYNPRGLALTPSADVGVDIRGAFEAGYWTSYCRESRLPSVIVYDFWIGNGPEETSTGNIALDCDFNDNNYNKSLGTRIGFRVEPFREIGFSCMAAQWNNNSRAFGFHSSRHNLYYAAAVVDLNWKFTENSKWMGEYIWTQRDAVKNAALGIHHHKVYQTGWWLQFSTFLNSWEGFLCLGCEKEPFWADVEFVIRGSQVDTDIADFNRRQLSLGLNYYISNTLIVKGSYDMNQGNGLRHSRATFQLAYAY